MSDPMQQSSQDNHAPQSGRWSRNHTIWLLIVLSLLPGVVIALFRDHWLELPAGVRGASHLTSAILIAAACFLILAGANRKARPSQSESISSSDDS